MDQLLSRLELERARCPLVGDPACIRAVASDVLAELGVSQPPVNVEMVASYLGVSQVVRDPELPEAGCLVCRASGIEIRVRAADSAGRQRFTICHECGHTFFPGFASAPRYRCSPAMRPNQKLDLEGLCDIAAGDLLLPPKLLVPDVARSGFGLDSVADLADAYDASLEATGHRFVVAWEEPAALLVFKVRQKPRQYGTGAAPQLRLVSAHTEGQWPFFARHKSVVEGDVFDRAVKGEIVHEQTTLVGICREAVRAEVSAQLFPYTANGQQELRVLALMRRTSR